MVALVHQRGRELKKEIDEALEKLLDQLSVRSPGVTPQFVLSEFSLEHLQLDHVAGQKEEPSATSVILDEGKPTSTTIVGEVIFIFIWSENYN